MLEILYGGDLPTTLSGGVGVLLIEARFGGYTLSFRLTALGLFFELNFAIVSIPENSLLNMQLFELKSGSW